MNSSSSNIFQQILIEEFEKNKEKRNMDLVVMKRKQFNILLEKAHNELRNKSYVMATKKYYTVINFLKDDPYPDELQLTSEMDYSIKCCLCYSGLLSPDRFKDDDVNNVMLDLIKELNDKFRKRLFPMFLLVLLNFYRKNWLDTLTWCSGVANLEDEEENSQGTEFFKELLPKASEVRCEVETFEEIAFFGYGEKLTRNALIKPRLEKYKNWSYKLDHLITSKISKLRTPISELDLHSVFHHDIFPIWCLANDTDSRDYFSDRYMTKCTQCMRTKLYHSIPRNEQNLTEDQQRFEKYVKQCAEFYHKYAYDLIFETMNTHNGKHKQLRLVEADPKKEDTPTKKKTCSALCQTDKLKTNNKNIQTEGIKSKNIETQVSNDMQVLSAVLEIKNKCLTLQEKKDDTIAKLNRKISELQEKANKDGNTRKATETEFETKITNFKFEIQKLKEQLSESERKHKSETEKNSTLQKLLVEQVNDKYNLHKQHYKAFEKQAEFMVAYLNDLSSWLSPKSIPDDRTCKYNLDIWRHHLQKIKHNLEELNHFYHKVRSDMINADIYDITWPEILEPPRFEDNIIFNSFKATNRTILQMEEKLAWKYTTDYQTQMQQRSVANYTYNMPRQQAPPQNVYVSPRFFYPSSAAPTMPVSLQYQPQQVQQPQKREILPGTVNVDPKLLSDQNLRTSKSMEFLNKTGGLQLASGQAWGGRATEQKGACALKKKGKKGKEPILLDYVMEHCPGASEGEVTLALLKLLDDNSGSLSNLPKEKIIDDVKIILRMKKQTAWVTPKSPHVNWTKDDTENDCSICFEPFSFQNKHTLPCKHEYHKECIKKWLRTSSVCPICRIHSVIDEEFPPLH